MIPSRCELLCLPVNLLQSDWVNTVRLDAISGLRERRLEQLNSSPVTLGHKGDPCHLGCEPLPALALSVKSSLQGEIAFNAEGLSMCNSLD